jgi:hypothetical protein
VVFIQQTRRGWRFEGHTTAVENHRAWSVRYTIGVDDQWRTRIAHVWSLSETSRLHRTLRSDGSGQWEIDGVPSLALNGCLDVDLEASACTNTFPVHQLPAAVDEPRDAPAAYVRVHELSVERLEQRYRPHAAGVYDYEAPRFEFACELRYDRTGLLLDYPGIAVRIL